jgi:hypothetical protein
MQVLNSSFEHFAAGFVRAGRLQVMQHVSLSKTLFKSVEAAHSVNVAREF